MTREAINELKKYTLGKKNTEKVEISILNLNRIIKALEQEPCDDAISRQVVLDEMYKRRKDGDAVTAGFIKKLPPVTPKPRKGHWIDGVCSECGWDAGQEAFSEDANFCMKCGVKMLPIGADKE